MATQELTFKISANPAAVKAAMAQVRSELNATAQVQKSTAQGELSMRQQLAAAASLQRQRSAALIQQWKQQEAAAKQLAAGVKPVSENLQRITDVMQTLGGASSTLQGPLGGVASRLRSVGTLATEAGGGLGIAGVAVGALVVAAGAGAVALYKITAAAAEFQGQMFDLSQQTGVSVETLSTLEAVARTTGGNIDSVVASLGVFQKNLEDAQDPTSKEAALLKTLGIETNNTEEALRQALSALALMPEGFTQTSRALDLFGRGGKQLLAILKETNGDLDATTERLRAMGILITTDAATAADKFNDRLAEVGLQIRGLTAIIGNEAMPTISKAIADASAFITANRSVIVGWTQDIGDAAKGAFVLAGYITTLTGAVTGLGNLPVPSVLRFLAAIDVTGISAILRGLKGLGSPDDIAPVAIPDLLVPLKSSTGSGTQIKAPRGGGGAKARDTRLDDATKAAALIEREAHLKAQADIAENKRSYEEQARDIEEFTRRAIELLDQRHDATIVRINAEQEALDAALARKAIKQKEYDEKDADLRIRNEEAIQKNTDETFKLEQDRDRKKSEAFIAAKRRELDIAEDADARQIKRIENRIKEEVLAESEGERQIAAIIDEGFERRRKALEAEETQYATTLERREDINAELIRLDADRAFAAEDAARRISKALFEEQNAAAQGATRKRRATGVDFETGEDAFAVFDRQLQEHLSGDKLVAAQAGLMALSESFRQVGQAVGEAVHAFVLFGGAGIGIKKFTATLIAEIARMAAVQAVWELAQGFAMSAMNFFWPDPRLAASAAAHFDAAAIYGGMAVIAAGAGRAVAGGAFAEATGGGSGSKAGGNPSDKRTGTSGSGDPKVQDFDRRNLNVPNATLTLTVPQGWLGSEMKRDYDLNGYSRMLIKEAP